jgi:hypothetical protein
MWFPDTQGSKSGSAPCWIVVKNDSVAVVLGEAVVDLWKTEAEVSLEGLKNLVVLANGSGLWLNVDKFANVGEGVGVENDDGLGVVVLETTEAEVNPPNSVLGDFCKVVVGKVGTVGTCWSKRGLTGSNWEVTASGGGSVGVSCWAVSCCCWVKTAEKRLAGGCGGNWAGAVNKFWPGNWLKRAKLEDDVVAVDTGGGPWAKNPEGGTCLVRIKGGNSLICNVAGDCLPVWSTTTDLAWSALTNCRWRLWRTLTGVAIGS